MALQFRPPPPVQEPDFNQQYVQPALQLASVLGQYKQNAAAQKDRQFQMEMLRAKEAREKGEYEYLYGDPSATMPMTTPSGFPAADPRMSLYQPATMPGETQYGNVMGGAQPDSYAPREMAATPMRPGGGMVDRFRQWQASRKAGGGMPDMNQELTNEQLFSPGFGAKRREDYLRTKKSRLEEADYERKGRETEADIKLKESQAGFYERNKGKTGGSGRYVGWTPQSLETRKRNLLSQLRYAALSEREPIMAQIQEIDEVQNQTLDAYGGGAAGGGAPGAAPKPVLRQPKPPNPAGKYQTGQIAVNPQTKERLMFNGSSWVPAPGRP